MPSVSFSTAVPRHLIIAFAGPGQAAPACRAAIAQLRLPALSTLLTRLAPAGEDVYDEDSFSPSHERALADALGLQAADGLLPWGALEAHGEHLPGAQPGEGWGIVTLCQWQVDLDDVVLAEPEALALSVAESQALRTAAAPLFAQEGLTLYPGTHPGHWLVHGTALAGLASASLDRVAGRSAARWSLQTPGARALLRLQNEVQMLFYTHPVNQARDAHDLPAVNAFWLSGTGVLPATAALDAPRPQLDRSLRQSLLRDDAQAWVQAWQALDAGPLAQCLEPLPARGARPLDNADGAGDTGDADTVLRLTLCGMRSARHFCNAPRALGARVWARVWTQMGARFRPPALAGVLEAL
ncbi:MAG: hypothetical protein LBV61_02265 [Burkholderiaceae bacterium]|nr:hypothetical protein [Burkholderiaceae bacterium]